MSILNIISAFFVLSGIIIAIYIAIDTYRKPQSMKIMNVVWILTGLWGSYLALYAYKTIGSHYNKNCNMEAEDMDDENMKDMPMGNMSNHSMMDMNMDMDTPSSFWKSVSLSALHCGAGCTLADIIGESFTYFHPITLASSNLVGGWILDTVLALIIGVFFQFFAIREMQKITATKAFFKAFKADFFSLLSWQIGMYGWMAIVYFVLFKGESLDKLSFSFWFMMQIAMLFGFIVAYPMNALLIKLNVKKGM